MGNDTDRSGVAAVAAEPATADGSNVVEQDPSAAAPPDGGYGWVCVGCVFFLNACTWGIAATYGVFLSHYLNHPTTSTSTAASPSPSAAPLDYAFIGGLQFGAALALASPITILTRRFGIRPPMLCGALVQTAGYLLASFADASSSARGIWQLYLTQGVLVGVGIGLAYLPSAAVTSQWFARRRSLANGIVSAGSGVGGIAFALATERVVGAAAGAAWALRMLAVVSGAVNLVAVALIRSRNAEVRATIRGFDAALLRREEVLLLLGWAFVSMLGYMTLLYSLSAYGRDALGLGDSRAAAVTAFLNLGTAVGRPALGWASDRVGRVEVAGSATAACAVLVFAVWVPSNSYGVLVFFAVVSGTILGVLWMTISPLCVEVAGLKDLNSMLSLAWATVVLPCTFSEVIALKIRRPDADRPYLYPQIYSGVAYAVAAAIMFRLWQVQRRKDPTSCGCSVV